MSPANTGAEPGVPNGVNVRNPFIVKGTAKLTVVFIGPSAGTVMGAATNWSVEPANVNGVYVTPLTVPGPSSKSRIVVLALIIVPGVNGPSAPLKHSDSSTTLKRSDPRRIGPQSSKVALSHPPDVMLTVSARTGAALHISRAASNP